MKDFSWATMDAIHQAARRLGSKPDVSWSDEREAIPGQGWQMNYIKTGQVNVLIVIGSHRKQFDGRAAESDIIAWLNELTEG